MSTIVKKITARLRRHPAEPTAPVEPLPDGRTIDYTRTGWGHNYVIHQVLDEGRELRCSGWGPAFGARVTRGDFLVLRGNEPGTTVCYQVVEIRRHMDPPDMWGATLQHVSGDVLSGTWAL